jgi:molybdopterin-guanine dinucleotide biosynthesis protein A
MIDSEDGHPEIREVQMSATHSMTSIVLAGGKGTRMGKHKVLEVVGGRPVLQRVIDSLNPMSRRILLVVAQGQQCPALEASQATVDCIHDVYAGKGALGGIYTGLSSSDSEHSLVVAGDMPFLNAGLIKYLISASPGFDVVMPRLDGLIQPLHAIYSKGCLPLIRAQLERGQLQIRVFLGEVRVRYVEAAEIDAFDPRRLSFFNINTPRDLEEARGIAAEMGLSR